MPSSFSICTYTGVECLTRSDLIQYNSTVMHSTQKWSKIGSSFHFSLI